MVFPRPSRKALLSAAIFAIIMLSPAPALIPSSIQPAFASCPYGSFYPRLVTDSFGDVHVVFWTSASGNPEIYYQKISGATGESYFDPVRITNAPGYSGRPVIDIDSHDNLHIAYLDDKGDDTNSEIYYQKLDKDGNSLVPETRVTNAPGRSIRPDIAVDSADNVHIAWYDSRDSIPGVVPANHEIYYAKLDNNGNKLLGDIRVTNAPNLSQRPYIDTDSQNNVHISFMDKRDGGDYEMYYTKLSGVDGSKLVPDFRLTYTPLLSGRNALRVDQNDNVHIVFMDQLGTIGNIEIFYVKLDVNGKPLIDNDHDGRPDNIRLTDHAGYSVRPDMDLDSFGNPHISWVEERDGPPGNREIYYTKLDNNGNTLVDDLRISNDPAISDRTYITVDKDNNAFIVWQDDRNGRPELYLSKLDNNGNILKDQVREFIGHPFEDPPATGLTMDSNGDAHIIYATALSTNIELYYTKVKGSDGTVLVNNKQVTNAPGFSMRPAMAVDSSNNIHLVYQDNRPGNMEIYYTKLDNNGNKLVDDRRLTFGTGYSLYPKVAVDTTGNVHVTWQDSPGLTDPTKDIYYMKLDNNGNPQTPVIRVTNTVQASTQPDIATDSAGFVYIVWEEILAGNSELYYAKLSNSGAILVPFVRLTVDPSATGRPSIAMDATNNLHITWSDGRDGNQEIYYMKLDNGGNKLISDLRITNKAGNSAVPTINVDKNGGETIVWRDVRNGGQEVFFVRLDSNGVRKNVNDVRVTFLAGMSRYVSSGTDASSNTHIAFISINDNHPASAEEYYTKVAKFGTQLIPPERLTFQS